MPPSGPVPQADAPKNEQPVPSKDSKAHKTVTSAQLEALLAELKAEESSFVEGETISSKPVEKEPTHQLSTIAYLLGFFGLIFLLSYLVHRAGGPHKVEAAVNHFFSRAKNAVMGGKGRYAKVQEGLPR